MATSYSEGQDLLKNKDFAQLAPLFTKIFEIGRRHKIMNPDKMRTEYGKMMIILQVRDSIRLGSNYARMLPLSKSKKTWGSALSPESKPCIIFYKRETHSIC